MGFMSSRRAVTIVSLVGFLIFLEILAAIMIPSGGAALDGKLSEADEKTIDILIDLTKLLMTYGYAILGAIAFLLQREDSSPLLKSSPHFAEALVTASAAIGSIFWGHIVFSGIITMMSHDFLDLHAPILVWAVRLQYFCLVLALIFLVSYVARNGKLR